MVSRYNAYVGNSGGNWGGGGGGGTASDSGSIVYLSFVGLPSSALLDSLVEYGVRAAFFLTADEIRQSPDTVRRIVGEGHSVGALCSADPSAEISSLLLDAARVKTVLIASAAPEYDESCIHVADVYGLVFWDYDTDCIQNGTGLTYASLITAYLEYRPARLDARILCCDATDACLPSVLSYINDNGFTARAPSEVNAPELE